MNKYTDLLVVDDDYELDEAGQPLLVHDRDCIAQDIKHMIREKGYLVQMIGERDVGSVETLMREIEFEAENDVRLVPGTAQMKRLDVENFAFVANTVDFGPLEVVL